MTRVFAFAPLSIIVAVLIAFLARTGMGRPDEPRAAPPPAVPPAALEGAAFPEVIAAALDAEHPGWRTDDLAGRAVVVNVWGSWCAACRAEFPVLAALAADGVPVYGVAWRDTGEDAAAFLADEGDPFAAVGLDAMDDLEERLALWGAPETFVIGPDGVVRLHRNGPIDALYVARHLKPALAE